MGKIVEGMALTGTIILPGKQVRSILGFYGTRDRAHLATKPEISHYRLQCFFSYGISFTELDDKDE